MMFLNPQKPIATCISKSCINCYLEGKIHCHFRPKDLIHFLLIAFPPFLLGGAEIYYLAAWLLIPWILFVFAFFGFIEIRVMCSHCPHYGEPGSSLKCWANYGSPKIWKFRPGPMTLIEKIIFFGGFIIIWGYPMVFFIIGKAYFLLIIYGMTTGGFFMTLITFMCTQCMNFACPLNQVEEKVKDLFFEKNPSVGEAWKKKNDKNYLSEFPSSGNKET